MSKNKNEDAFDFEKGMQRLEEIISKFDEGGLPLDQMETIFIEGMELVKRCSERLDRVETRVTQLLHDPETGWIEQPFEEEEKAEE